MFRCSTQLGPVKSMQKIVLYKKLIVTVAEEAALSWVD